MIWMAVTADEYELPLIVRDTSMELAKAIGCNQTTIFASVNTDRISRKKFNSCNYFIRRVIE